MSSRVSGFRLSIIQSKDKDKENGMTEENLFLKSVLVDLTISPIFVGLG